MAIKLVKKVTKSVEKHFAKLDALDVDYIVHGALTLANDADELVRELRQNSRR